MQKGWVFLGIVDETRFRSVGAASLAVRNKWASVADEEKRLA